MTRSVRYQQGQLYQDHGAWFVRYRDRLRQKDGSIKLRRKASRLGSVEEFPTKTKIEPLRTSFMQKINAGRFDPDSSMTLSDFVEKSYLPWVEAELRASTHKGYREIWENHVSQRVGKIRLREFRTVHVSKMLRAIADESDLTKTTLQHIKSVLSGIFTYAKNEDAYDGANPVQGAMIPGKARDPGDTFAYNLVQILRILQILPLLPKAVVATASFAGLREGELRGLEWPDYTGEALTVNRSVWKNVINRPKTRKSQQPVPVIAKLAKILEEYRASMQLKPLDYRGMDGMVSVAVLRPIYMNWALMRRSCNGFCVMPIHTSPGIATSRLSILQYWRRCSECKQPWRCLSGVQQ